MTKPELLEMMTNHIENHDGFLKTLVSEMVDALTEVHSTLPGPDGTAPMVVLGQPGQVL